MEFLGGLVRLDKIMSSEKKVKKSALAESRHLKLLNHLPTSTAY